MDAKAISGRRRSRLASPRGRFEAARRWWRRSHGQRSARERHGVDVRHLPVGIVSGDEIGRERIEDHRGAVGADPPLRTVSVGQLPVGGGADDAGRSKTAIEDDDLPGRGKKAILDDRLKDYEPSVAADARIEDGLEPARPACGRRLQGRRAVRQVEDYRSGSSSLSSGTSCAADVNATNKVMTVSLGISERLPRMGRPSHHDVTRAGAARSKLMRCDKS